jgi:uncharacterized protein (TIGR02246 family)
MKQIIFLTIITGCFHLISLAQGNHVAESYRSFSMAYLAQGSGYPETTDPLFSAVPAPAQTFSTDEAAIQAIIASMQKGWNEKSGKAFASVFDKLHDYIVVNGMYLKGITPEMNADAHQGIFNSIYKTMDLEIRLDNTSFIRPDLAMVHVLSGLYEHGTPVPENPGAIASILIEKKNDVWKIISFHNAHIEMSFDPARQESPVPLKVMYAGWYKK